MSPEEFTAMLTQFTESVTPSQAIFIGLAIALFSALLMATFMGYFRILYNIASFAYPTARVKAIGNPFIQLKAVNALIESRSISQFLDTLIESGYAIDEGSEMDINAIEGVLERSYIREYIELEATVPEGIKPFFSAYRMVLEADQVKHAILGKMMGLAPDTIEGGLIPIGGLSPTLIRRMANARGIEGLVAQLQTTPYGNALSSALSDYGEEMAPLPLYLALDRYVSQQLRDAQLNVDRSLSGPIDAFIQRYTDIAMIKSLIRAKNLEFKSERLQRYLLSDSMEVSGIGVLLKRLDEYKGVNQILAELERTPYAAAIEEALPLYESTGSMHPIERALDRLLLDTVISIGTVHHLSGGPLIKFIVARQFEIRNIRAVLNGIHEGAAPESMKNVVICDRAAV